MKRRKQHMYKKHLEEGTSPPSSTKYRYRDLNKGSDSSIDDQQAFYNLVGISCSGKKNVSSTDESSSTDSKSSRNDEVNVDVEQLIHDDLIINSAEHSDEYDIEYYEQQVPMNVRLSKCTDDVTSDFDSNFDDFEAEEEFYDTTSSYSELKNHLNNKEMTETVNARFVVSKLEILYAMEKFLDLYSLPISALEYQCKMLNSFVSSSIVPESKYHLDKLLRSKDSVQYHAVCSDCDIYLGEFDCSQKYIECCKCKKNVALRGENRNHFVILNIEDDIKSKIEKHQDYYMQVTISNPEQQTLIFSDINDGLEYKKFINSLPENEKESFITCSFNTDGSPVFKSTNYSIWPIQIQLNELPCNVRFNETITCALWFSKSKPNLNILLKSFIKKINDINANGIPCKLNNTVRNLKLYPICCCVDAVARAPIQGHIQFNGSYGCGWCYHPGVKVMHKKKKL